MIFLNFLSRLFLLVLISLSSFSVVKASSNVGVLNLVRIYREYSLVQEANLVIEEGEEGLKRVIATAEAEVKKLESEKNEQEKEKKLDEIQASVDEKVEEVQDLKENYNMTINRNIQTVIDQIAQKKSYVAVFDKAFSVFAADDITDEVLTELEKIKKN